MTTTKPSWDEYFMHLAEEVATRSTCIRRHVGAVAVNEHHRIIGTGYNGAPSGMPHCTPETCVRNIHHVKSGTAVEFTRAIHAEANIVLQLGEQLEDCTLYCTNQPCVSCLKLLMGCHVRRVVWKEPYDDMLSEQMMNEYGSVSTTEHGYHQLIRYDSVDPVTEQPTHSENLLSQVKSWIRRGFL